MEVCTSVNVGVFGFLRYLVICASSCFICVGMISLWNIGKVNFELHTHFGLSFVLKLFMYVCWLRMIFEIGSGGFMVVYCVGLRALIGRSSVAMVDCSFEMYVGCNDGWYLSVMLSDMPLFMIIVGMLKEM